MPHIYLYLAPVVSEMTGGQQEPVLNFDNPFTPQIPLPAHQAIVTVVTAVPLILKWPVLPADHGDCGGRIRFGHRLAYDWRADRQVAVCFHRGADLMSLQRMGCEQPATAFFRQPWRRALVCAVAATCIWAVPSGSLAQPPGDDRLAAENAPSAPTAAQGGNSASPPPSSPQPRRPPQPPQTSPRSPATPATPAGPAPASAVPYMLGDLFRSSASINFIYEKVSTDINTGAVGVEAGGFINLRNAKVADNNNAVPSDRVSYEFNSFENGEGLVGTSSNTEPTGLPVTSPPTYPQLKYTTQQVNYDVGLHTLQYEKSFDDGLFSIEARVPFSCGLSSQLNLSAAQINGVDAFASPYGPLYALDLTPTPQDTWGETGWQLEDISLIFKMVLYRDLARNLWFSGGVQVVAPTAPNIDVQVTDYWTVGYNQAIYLDTTGMRERTFHVSNQTWALSPYLALSAAPGRQFFNGFLQLDVPVGSDGVGFAQRFYSTFNTNTFQSVPALQPVSLLFPGGQAAQDNYEGRIRDQVLMHVDAAWGYWLYQNPQAKWIRAVAPTLEFHLTQTLQRPQVLVLPGSPLNLYSLPGFPLEPPPTVGNPAASNTITDFTVGIDTRIGDRTTLNVATPFPWERASIAHSTARSW